MNLYGASGHCKVVIDAIQSLNNSIENIFDDNPMHDTILGLPVFKTDLQKLNELKNFIVTIGNNKVRKQVVQNLKTTFAVVIHSKSIISKTVFVGDGSVVLAGAIINSDAVIKKHCIINTSSVVEHDCIIENYVHVSPNVSIAGGVFIDEGAHIGIGATIIQGIRIGKWATIGAGAVVINDIPDYAVVVGNPAKIIKFNI